MAAGRSPALVDARIYDGVIWILRRYHLRVNAARETGHRTHGDGTAIDLVPADGITQPVWDASAGRLAHALGWTPGCGRSGSRPACPLVPAVQFVGYDGYPSHGSPRTCNGDCPAHIHISWASPCYGASGLAPPCPWVIAFPVPPELALATAFSATRLPSSREGTPSTPATRSRAQRVYASRASRLAGD